MKPADLGELNDPALGRCLGGTMVGSILTERQMGSPPVVVGQVRVEDAPQVSLVENDHVVETLYDLRTDPHEMQNVYPDPAYADTVRRLRTELTRLRRQVGDTDEAYPELQRLAKG